MNIVEGIEIFHRYENIVAKEGKLFYEQFLLLPQRFQMTSATVASELVCSWVKG